MTDSDKMRWHLLHAEELETRRLKKAAEKRDRRNSSKWRLWLCFFNGEWFLDRDESGRVRTWSDSFDADEKGRFLVQNTKNFIAWEVEGVAFGTKYAETA